MIHARIDAVDSKNIVGFECGNRADFDVRHGADPLWIFLDFSTVNYRIRTEEFFDNPLQFFIDKRGLVQRRLKPEEFKKLTYLVEADKYLRDDDNTYLNERIYMPARP